MKLHLGSGKKYLPGYTHIDLADHPHIDFCCPIYPLPNFNNESVDEIYVSHALEYYDFEEAVNVLNEWNRILKKGGMLRLSVPDIDKLIRVYNDSSKQIDRIIGPIFGRWQLNEGYIYHKTLYNRKKLLELISQAKFRSAHDWDPIKHFGKEKDDFDDYSKAYYPHMDFENGYPISLNILAIK